ncbi:effector binding domain-containing protein [Chryseobacterium sp. Ch-15]|uniref:Effector binding domain-containing protein n=1 Tax=Chryseobacterium muglaense TaxID=2893752 RepID=A0A9Q3UPQ3_9FLAO|nr:effector binding domain-containing protein [Chryseobacterium muglaense]MBD3907246.1 effector binding domain-containing protein [Chryseobacterium muglaense]MCC9033163.1 effector binding domain-containing protein [Chryseobacterium muglaense]MCM2556101.1 effector binding domain-containing protein [Chryseobacterium muglaense]
MNKIKIQKFYIVGISVRTTNENGQASQDIERLWERFWNEDIKSQIPNKINDETYAVYTDYESDFTGNYTTIIGLPVNSLVDIPDNFVRITIETDEYQKFVSKGKMPEAVVNTWLEIWADKELNSRRAYRADFTVHGKKYNHGNNAEVQTYLSIKN